MFLLPSIVRQRLAQRPNLVRILDNVSWLVVDKLIHLGLGLIVGVWIARYLGPKQFGLINYATAFVGLFGTFATLGLNSIVVRDLVSEPKTASHTLGSAAALQLIGAFVAFSLVTFSIRFFRPDDNLAQSIVAIFGSAMILKVSIVASYWFEAEVRSKYMVWVSNVVFLIFALAKVLLIVLGCHLMTFVWVMFAETATAAFVTIVVFGWVGPGFRLLHASVDRAAKLLKDSWPLILSGMAVVIYMKIDLIMLGQMLGDDAVGIYSAAARVSEVWYFIPMTISASVFPAILEAKKKSAEIYYKRLQQLFDVMVVFAVAVALPMTFLSDWLVVALFGIAYESAGPVLAIHIWSAVFVFLWVASGKWIIAENRQIISFERALIGAVVNVVLNLFLIPEYGPVGAAWATVIAYSIVAFFFDGIQAETRQIFVMKLRSFNLLASVKRVKVLTSDSLTGSIQKT